MIVKYLCDQGTRVALAVAAVGVLGSAWRRVATLPPAPTAHCASAARRTNMAWTTPRIVEIALGCEINTYACAEIAAKD